MKSCSTSPHDCCHLWLGLVAFTIGAVFLLQMFDVIPEATWSYLWPIILVVSGLKMMIKSCCCSSCEGASCDTACCESSCMPCEKPAPKKKAPAKKKAKKVMKKK